MLSSVADLSMKKPMRQISGEVLSITSGAVDQCLGPGADQILFETLVEAALASEESSNGENGTVTPKTLEHHITL